MRFYRSRLLVSAALFVVVVSGGFPAYAIDWGGGTSSDWHNPANWVGGVIPVAGSTVNIKVPNGLASITDDASYNNLYVGSASGTSLEISDEGNLVGTSLSVGDLVGEIGTLTISGADASLATQWLYAGFRGDGTIRIENGASATATTSLLLGNFAGSSGTFTVDGDGSSWTISSGATIIGHTGEGNYTVSGGATATDYSVTIGYADGGVGTALIDGDNTTWSVTFGTLIMGYGGEGDLTISNGAQVNAANRVVLGYNSSGEGTLNLTGAGSGLSLTSAVPNSSIVVVGNYGEGTINVSDGAAVTSAYGIMGWFASGNGTLDVSGADTRWENSAYLAVGYGGIGEATARDGGTIAVTGNAGVRIGYLAGSTGTLNIGAAAGDAAGAAGHINSANVVFGPGSGTLVFNHTNTSYDFSPAISGTGFINHLSGVTTFSGNSATLGGITSISGGTALVTGSLGGIIDVVNNGTLGGTGTVGKSGSTLSIGNGGTLSPGLVGSRGTLSVVGDLAFSTGSTYVVQVSGLSSDAVVLTGGDVTINPGTSLQISLSGAANASRYTILTATSVTGTFSTIDWGGLSNYEISYDNGVVSLLSTVSVGNGGSNLTPNQSAVLSVLQSGGAPGSLWSSLGSIPDNEQEEALRQLSGETHTAPRAAFFQTAQSVNNTVNGRIRTMTDGVAAPSVPALGYAEESKQPKGGQFTAFENKADVFDQNRFSVWTNGFGSWGKVDGLTGSPDTDISNAGVLIGGDATIGDNWRVGLFGGYSRSSFDTSDSDGNSNNYHLGAYAGSRWDAISFRTGINYTWHRVDTVRQVDFLGETLRADYDASTLNMFGELSYRIDVAPAAFEPFLSLSHMRVKTDGFTETGGVSALTMDESSLNTTYTTLGLRASTDLNVGSVPATLRGSLGWIYAFGDVEPETTARFSSGDSFRVVGTPLDRHTALVQTGMDFALSSASTLSISYTGQFSAKAYDHGINAKLQVRF
jgi:outer membrane autotransporter protein